MNKIIEVRNLIKTYGKRSASFTALNGINLDIYEGESLAIVGKSGSGKSTFMHLLALLDRPTSGTITIAGVDSTQLGNHRINQLRNHSFGFVFQQFFLNPSDTVLQNVTLPLKIAGVRRKTRHNLAMRALETVGLADRVNFKANDLSGGQKQRVCIARAVVNNPKIIFADEPTGNLDSATGKKIIDLLFDFNKQRNATLIIVTHDDELAAMCDRQIRLIDGKIVSDTRSIAKDTVSAPAIQNNFAKDPTAQPATAAPIATTQSAITSAAMTQSTVAQAAPASTITTTLPPAPSSAQIPTPTPKPSLKLAPNLASNPAPNLNPAPTTTRPPRTSNNMPVMSTAEHPSTPPITPTKGVI